MTTPAVTTKEHLENGLTYLHEHGWVQGQSHRDEDGAGCLLGVIWYGSKEANGDFLGSEDYVAVTSVLTSVIGSPGIINWNDHPGRTQEEVEDALKKAIEKA